MGKLAGKWEMIKNGGEIVVDWIWYLFTSVCGGCNSGGPEWSVDRVIWV